VKYKKQIDIYEKKKYYGIFFFLNMFFVLFSSSTTRSILPKNTSKTQVFAPFFFHKACNHFAMPNNSSDLLIIIVP